MRKTFRHTIGVLVLLAFGTLVTACHRSSDKDQSGQKIPSVNASKETAPSKGERTQARTASSPRTDSAASKASDPATQKNSVASTKATHAQPTTLAKAQTASKSAEKPSKTASSGYTNYADLEAK